MTRDIDYIVIHCTASSQKATVEGIQRYWREKLGWKDPGYHFIVDTEGKTTILQPIHKVANGVRGYNGRSIHISYIGGIDENGKAKDTRTVRQKEEMKCIIEDLLNILPNKPDILGHRDLSPDKNGNGIIEPHEWLKECPSFNVREWIEEINL